MSDQPTLNKEAVQRRLRALRERLDELNQVAEVTEEELESNWMVRAATERILTQLVELAVHVNMHVTTAAGKLPPTGYRDSFAVMAEVGGISSELAERLGPASGLRNVLVHHYLDVDLSIVADSVGQAATDFAAYVTDVATWLDSQANPEADNDE